MNQSDYNPSATIGGLTRAAGKSALDGGTGEGGQHTDRLQTDSIRRVEIHSRLVVPLRRTPKPDVISSMPDNAITNILDRLPIQDAVRTSTLSRKWKSKWTLLTHLVFDKNFFQYLQRTKNGNYFNGRNLSRILLHLQGDITKFVLYIPEEYYFILDVEDINHWVMFLSTKKVKEFTLINMLQTPLRLPTHLSSCLQLKHLELRNCFFSPAPGSRSFPNLLRLDLNTVRIENYNFGKFIVRCPLLEILRIDHYDCTVKLRPTSICKVGNLKILSLSLCKLKNMAITSSGIFQLLGYLPKLEDLALDFQNCKFVGEAGARKRVSASLSLKKLTLCKLDFNNSAMVLFAVNLIHGSPNLQNLKIIGTKEEHFSRPALSSWEIDYGLTGKLQLQIVELECIKDSEIEVCLIKSLLANSSLLKKMIINHISGVCESCNGNYMFAKKLLKFYRASPIAEIDLN